MIRSQLNTYSGSDPIWGFVALIGAERFTGEAAVGINPRIRLFAVDGRLYFAEREGDAPIGARLVSSGVVSAEQLARGSVQLGEHASMARLFQRDPSVDRDAVELTITSSTESLLVQVANRAVGMPEIFPLRHHSSGLHHWLQAPAPAPALTPIVTEPEPEPFVDEPAVVAAAAIEEAVAEDAIIDDVAEAAVTEEAINEEAINEEPTTEEPSIEAAVIEEAVIEEAEEAVTEEAVTEEAVIEEAVIEAPAVDAATITPAVSSDAPFACHSGHELHTKAAPVDDSGTEPTWVRPALATLAAIPLPAFAPMAGQPVRHDELLDEELADALPPVSAGALLTALPTLPGVPALPGLPPLVSSATPGLYAVPAVAAADATPHTLPDDLGTPHADPPLPDAPASLSDLPAGNAEPAPAFGGATHTLAAIDIWQMVDVMLDDDDAELEFVGGGGGGKRGRSWLRGRKG